MADHTRKFNKFSCIFVFLTYSSICSTFSSEEIKFDVFDNDQLGLLPEIPSSADLIANATIIPGTDIENSCKAFISKYALIAAGFTDCSIRNARPLKFCEKCVKDYAMAKSVYWQIMKVRSFVTNTSTPGALI